MRATAFFSIFAVSTAKLMPTDNFMDSPPERRASTTTTLQPGKRSHTPKPVPKEKPERPAESVADVLQVYAKSMDDVCRICAPIVSHASMADDPCTCIVKEGLAYDPEGYDPGRKWSDGKDSKLHAYQCIPNRYLQTDFLQQISQMKCGCIYDQYFRAQKCEMGKGPIRWDDHPESHSDDPAEWRQITERTLERAKALGHDL